LSIESDGVHAIACRLEHVTAITLLPRQSCFTSRTLEALPRYRARVPFGVLMTSRNSQWVFAVIASATMAGCASTPTGVLPAGQDAYRVSALGARYETQTDTNLKALSVANQYCEQLGKHVMFRQSTESSEHAWSPKQENLVFVCMDSKDPAYMRAAVERDPPVVAKED